MTSPPGLSLSFSRSPENARTSSSSRATLPVPGNGGVMPSPPGLSLSFSRSPENACTSSSSRAALPVAQGVIDAARVPSASVVSQSTDERRTALLERLIARQEQGTQTVQQSVMDMRFCVSQLDMIRRLAADSKLSDFSDYWAPDHHKKEPFKPDTFVPARLPEISSLKPFLTFTIRKIPLTIVFPRRSWEGRYTRSKGSIFLRTSRGGCLLSSMHM